MLIALCVVIEAILLMGDLDMFGAPRLRQWAYEMAGSGPVCCATGAPTMPASPI